MLWICDHYHDYQYVYSCSAGIDFRRQILTSKVDPRTVRVNVGLIYQNSLATAIYNLKWLKITHIGLI